jgi:hypothetical protein
VELPAAEAERVEAVAAQERPETAVPLAQVEASRTPDPSMPAPVDAPVREAVAPAEPVAPAQVAAAQVEREAALRMPAAPVAQVAAAQVAAAQVEREAALQMRACPRVTLRPM